MEDFTITLNSDEFSLLSVALSTIAIEAKIKLAHGSLSDDVRKFLDCEIKAVEDLQRKLDNSYYGF